MAKPEKKKAYIDSLILELSKNASKYANLKTVYIGGGTPSSLNNELLSKLFDNIHRHINVNALEEFTIETNPNDITLDKALLFNKYGVNRVSVGVQTFNLKHLEFLNREHNVYDIEEAIKNLRKAGIMNVSIDMIFSIINQSIDDLELDLDELLKLDVDHVSYYSLILEEKTKLYDLYNKGIISVNTEDLEALMYNKVIERLKDNGYQHYEISNFCKPGFESKHNMVYWQNIEYLGIGAGAHSLMDDKRFYNVSSVMKYIDKIDNGLEYQTSYDRDSLSEHIIMGLRMLKGIDINEINKRYQIDFLEKYDKVVEFINNGLLEESNGYIKLTDKGLFVGNVIFAHFLEG